MKTFGEIMSTLFKTLISFAGLVLKSAWWILIVGVLSVVATFFLAIPFNAEVQGAIEIFKNLFKIP